MTKKLTLSIFFCLLFLCFSCKRQNRKDSDYNKTINDYDQLINYAERDEQEQLQRKLDELGAEEKFHLQKLAKNQKETSTILKINQLLESEKYDSASTLIHEHIRSHGISPALEELRTTVKSLQKFKKMRLQAENAKLSKKELIKLQTEMNEVFPKSAGLNTTKMAIWFQHQHKLIKINAEKKLDRYRTIALIQLDQTNTELDLQSKAGAEIYFRELQLHSLQSQRHTNLRNSIIAFNTQLGTQPASISEAVIQLFKRSGKQQLATTLIELNELEKGTKISQSLKDRILRSALYAKNIEMEKLNSSPLLNLPTLMEIIIKSEE